MGTRIKQTWRAIFAAIVLVGPVIKGILWVTERAGDLEFLATNWRRIMGIIGAPWFALVAVPIGLGMIWWHFSKRSAPNTPIIHPNARSGGIAKCRGCGLQHFFASRYALSRERPLKQIFRTSKVIWAYWNTGTTAWSNDMLKERTQPLKMLILPNLYGEGPKALARIGGKSKADLANDIKAVTREAIKANIPVKWFNGDVGNTIMLGEPLDSDDDVGNEEWVQVETLFPIPTDERPSFWVTVAEYKPLVTSLHKAFRQMWKESKPPAR